MTRLRYNGLSNSLGASLTAGGTTITFASKLTYAGGDVPTISGSDYIPLSILDSDGNCAEVVHLTAYTEDATTGTIARGKEDTSGVAHSSGAVVTHGPTASDLAVMAVMSGPSSSQSFSAGTWAEINLDAVLFESGGTTGSTANNAITVPVTGLYSIYVTMEWLENQSSGTETLYYRLVKNDVTTDVPWVRAQHDRVTTTFSHTWFETLSANDEVTIQAFAQNARDIRAESNSVRNRVAIRLLP